MVLFEELIGMPASTWAAVGILSIEKAISECIGPPCNFVTELSLVI